MHSAIRVQREEGTVHSAITVQREEGTVHSALWIQRQTLVTEQTFRVTRRQTSLNKTDVSLNQYQPMSPASTTVHAVGTS